MPLQLRRGTQSEFDAITPADGELIYVKPDGSIGAKLYIGDGITQGSDLLPVIGFSSNEAKDSFAESISDGTQTNISFDYNPTTRAMDVTVDLESYTGNITATVKSQADVTLVDTVAGVIPAAVVQGTFTGTHIGDVETNSIVSSDSGEIIVGSPISFDAPITVNSSLLGTLTGNLKTSIDNVSYDHILNVFYPNGLEFQGGAVVRSASNIIEFEVSSTRFTTNTFTVARNGYAGVGPWINISQWHNTPDAENLSFNRARGTSTSPLTTQINDDIADIVFAGYDGTAFIPGMAISVTVDKAVSTGIVPLRLSVLMQDELGNLNEKVRLESSRAVFNIVPQLPSFTNEAAAISAIGTPANGMMYYDQALAKIRAYAGNAWVNLH